MQHVRVGQDEVGVVPDPAAGRGVGVAVVRFGPHGGQLQGTDGGELVGGKRLRGGEVKRDGAVVVDFPGLGHHPQLGAVDGVQRRQLVGERFSGGSAGGDHHVLTAVGEVGGLDLVPVRFVDAQGAVGGHQVGVGPIRPRLVDGLACGDGVDMTQLLRVRAAAQQRDQRVMGVHPNILSPAEKSARTDRSAILVRGGQHQHTAHNGPAQV